MPKVQNDLVGLCGVATAADDAAQAENETVIGLDHRGECSDARLRWPADQLNRQTKPLGKGLRCSSRANYRGCKATESCVLQRSVECCIRVPRCQAKDSNPRQSAGARGASQLLIGGWGWGKPVEMPKEAGETKTGDRDTAKPSISPPKQRHTLRWGEDVAGCATLRRQRDPQRKGRQSRAKAGPRFHRGRED